MLSSQSLMPAAAGTPRYEKRGATHTPPLDSGFRLTIGGFFHRLVELSLE